MPRRGRIGDNTKAATTPAGQEKKPKERKKKEFAEHEPKLSVQNTRLSHALPSVQPKFKDVGILDGEEKKVETGKVPDVSYVMCKLAIKEDGASAGLLPGKKVSYFDFCVMNAMYTLWTRRADKTKKECDFTYSDIYRTMTGSMEDKKIGSTTLAQIDAAIGRLSCIEAAVDTRFEIPEVQEKLEALGIRKKGITIDTLVSAKRYIREARNHKTITGNVTLRDCPILCAYAESVGQIVQIPYKALDVMNADGTPKRKDEKFIAVQECLALHIASIRNSAIENHAIGISTIIEKTGYDYDAEFRATKKRDREAIEDVLNHYKRIGYISDFTIDPKKDLIYITD